MGVEQMALSWFDLIIFRVTDNRLMNFLVNNFVPSFFEYKKITRMSFCFLLFCEDGKSTKIFFRLQFIFLPRGFD